MRYKKITSLSNPLIKEALKAKKTGQRNTLIIEGHRLLEMALASGTEISRVFFTENYRSKNEDFLRHVSARASELIETTEQIISRISETDSPQGIAALMSYKTRALREISLASNPLIALCDGIQDPGNLGTIIRTADAAGADAVIILPGTCDPFMPKTIRATAGSIFNLPVLFAEPEELVGWLRKRSIGLVVADAHASRTVYDADFRKPLAFVFGNEAAGVSEHLRKNSDSLVSIPIRGKAESLNVAASAAICLFEAVRQRRGGSRSNG
jgi:TrmH family RNA methyltransferase